MSVPTITCCSPSFRHEQSHLDEHVVELEGQQLSNFQWNVTALIRLLSVAYAISWLGGSVMVERRSLTGELSLVYTGTAADG